MKNPLIITIILFFTISCTYAQNLTSTDFDLSGAGRPVGWNDFRTQVALSSGNFASVKAPEIATEGTVYLFDDWKNKAVIKLDKKKYVFSNFNYNISQENFMSQIEGDSIYIFDFKKIDKVIVNGKEFRSFFSPIDDAEKIFQVIYENDNFSILKKYSVKTIESSPDPMLNRSKNKIVKIETYFLAQGTTLTPIKLKKKLITQLVEKDIAISALNDYVKSNNLSYKNENDLKKILDYCYKSKQPN